MGDINLWGTKFSGGVEKRILSFIFHQKMSDTWTTMGVLRVHDRCGQVLSDAKTKGHQCTPFGTKKTYICSVPGCMAIFKGAIGKHLEASHRDKDQAVERQIFHARIVAAHTPLPTRQGPPCLCLASDYPTRPTLPWTPALAATVRHFVNRGNYGEWHPLFKDTVDDYFMAATVARSRMSSFAKLYSHTIEWNCAFRFLRLFAADAPVHGLAEPHPAATDGPCEIVEGRPRRVELIKHYMLADWQTRTATDTAFRTANLVYFTDMATPASTDYAYVVFRAYVAHADVRNYELVEMMLTAIFWAMFPETLKRPGGGGGELEGRPRKRQRTSAGPRSADDTDE